MWTPRLQAASEHALSAAHPAGHTGRGAADRCAPRRLVISAFVSEVKRDTLTRWNTLQGVRGRRHEAAPDLRVRVSDACG